MSTTLKGSRGRIARLLLALYPQAWRERYEIEMLALLEDDPPTAAALCSLLAGAADAHLSQDSSWRATSSPSQRLRLSIGAIFCCWIALSVMGVGFQQETEDVSSSVSQGHHPLLALAHDATFTGALLGAAAIAFGGLPLLWQALRQAYRFGDRRLALLIAAPGLAILAFSGLSWLLLRIAPSRQGGFPLGFVLTIMTPWQLGAVACAAACALAPRFVMARALPLRAALKRAAHASQLLIAAMALVTVGLALSAICLPLETPRLAAEASGPVGASTAAMVGFNAAVALLVSALAALSAKRSRHAVTGLH